MRLFDEIEEVVVPDVHLDDAPAAGKGLGEGGNLGHQPVSAMQLRQPHQIVGGGSEGEGPSDAVAAAEPGLLLPGDRLDPAERLLDALADALADGIAAVPGRARVDRRAAAAGVLRHMRRHRSSSAAR